MKKPESVAAAYLGSRSGVLTILLVVSALYLWMLADRDWIPFDDGSLGHAAERVMEGQWPHRDFDDIYTGLQAVYHATLFILFGPDLLALRTGLFIFSLLFVSAIFAIASRFFLPWVAGAIALLCLVWSVPNYFAALPSWYNLFFAAFATWAALRHLETGALIWLFWTGVLLGLSMLFKIAGLYAVAAGGLFLIYREQTLAARLKNEPRAKAYSVAVWGAAAVFLACLIWLVRNRASPASLFHFLVPGMTLAAVIALNEWKYFLKPRTGRAAQMLRLLLPYLAGVVAPVLLFILPYAVSSSLDPLWHGVFVRPQMRLQKTFIQMPSLGPQLLLALPLVLLLAGGRWIKWRKMERALLVPACAGLALVLWLGDRESVYSAVWASLRPIVPIVTLLACPLLLGTGSAEKQKLFLAVAMAAMASLIQFPASLGIYFCYAAPMGLLALAILVSIKAAAAPRRLLLGLTGFYFLFAAIWLNRSDTFLLGFRHVPLKTAPLGLERAHLQVAPYWVEIYRALASEVRKRSAPGEKILAFPDSPEVYFLCDRENPTRTLYEIFDDDYRDETAWTKRLQRTLEENNVNVVVLRWGGEIYSRTAPPELLDWMLKRYPHAVRMPRDYFTVLWRDPEPKKP